VTADSPKQGLPKPLFRISASVSVDGRLEERGLPVPTTKD
jgi:hypothetical protein